MQNLTERKVNLYNEKLSIINLNYIMINIILDHVYDSRILNNLYLIKDENLI